MRIGGKIGAGVVVLGLVLSTAQAANASAPPQKNRSSSKTITLITGDTVNLLDKTTVSVKPGKGREKVTFSRFVANGHTYVIPNDAGQLVATGQLDKRLFDLTTLVEFGYDDERSDSTPLIVTHPDGQPAFRTAAAPVSRELSSINGVAMSAKKSDASAVWDALTDGGAMRTATAGVSRVWLDGKRKASLDRSTAQIGAPSAWAAGYTGARVKIAVLDTGVDQTHPDLSRKEVAEKNFSASADSVDRFGHGTHVASIAAGTGKKSGGKYRGVAPGALLLDGKVLDDGGWGTDSDIIAGMEWAGQQGADIANLSLGGPNTPDVDPMEQAVETLTAKYGILFVIAAGNYGQEGTIASPGSAPSALTVGAVDRDDSLAYFSSQGPVAGDGAIKPDVTAPGVGIVAALHSAGVIAPPVVDGYTALSGTSMASPHVAGAAALVLQKHPTWTGQQLKSALSGSAKPTAGLNAFEQGAGRIDLTKAMSQTVVSEPANVSFGVVAWPHDDDQPVTRTLTYRNMSAADVTLDLSVAGATGPGGATTNVFTLSANRITVPAGGTAAVDVTGDAKLGTADGAYSATVVATAGQSVTRTPVAITREDERYSLTVNYVGRDGQPASEYRTVLLGLDNDDFMYLYEADGSLTVRLPKGRYVLDHLLIDPDGHGNIIMQPGVALDHDQTFTVDAATANTNKVTTPKATTLGWAEIGYQVEGGNSYPISGGFLTNIDLDVVSTAQLGDPLPGTTTKNWVSIASSDADGAIYGLAWFLDRFPNGFVKAVNQGDLATIRRNYGPGAPGDIGIPFLGPQPPTGTAYTGATGYEVSLPSTHTIYVNTDSVRWETRMWITQDFFPIAELISPVRTYAAGKTYDEPFNHPVFGPGLPPSDSPWAYRSADDYISVGVPLFTDSGGNAGFTTTGGVTRLYRGGQLVGENPYGGYGYFQDLPTAAGDYRLTTQADTPSRFGPTSWIGLEWTFSSAHVDNDTALPLSVIRYLPKLDANDNGPAGQQFLVPMQIQDKTGATYVPRSLTVEVSYDDGKTWQAAQYNSKLVLKLRHPAGAATVSFRATASDNDGNTVKQTLIRAYTLR